MRYVSYFEEWTLPVPKPLPVSLEIIEHYTFVTRTPLGMMENSTVHTIIASLPTMSGHMHAIHRGHLSRPLGVIAGGHVARMAA